LSAERQKRGIPKKGIKLFVAEELLVMEKIITSAVSFSGTKLRVSICIFSLFTWQLVLYHKGPAWIVVDGFLFMLSERFIIRSFEKYNQRFLDKKALFKSVIDTGGVKKLCWSVFISPQRIGEMLEKILP